VGQEDKLVLGVVKILHIDRLYARQNASERPPIRGLLGIPATGERRGSVGESRPLSPLCALLDRVNLPGFFRP
jgi:hypothetical protein